MSNKERLRITELDFDGIKSNLKTFLKKAYFGWKSLNKLESQFSHYLEKVNF